MASLLPSDLYAGVYKSIVADPQAVRLQREQQARSQAERGELARKQAQQAELEKVLGGVQQGDPQALSRFMQLDPKGAMDYQEAQQKQKDAQAQARTQGLMGLMGLPEDQRATAYPAYRSQLGGAESGLPEQYEPNSLLAMMHTGIKPETQADLRKPAPDNRPADVKEYEFYTQQETGAGRKPASFNDWRLQRAKASAPVTNVSTNVGGQKVPDNVINASLKALEESNAMEEQVQDIENFLRLSEVTPTGFTAPITLPMKALLEDFGWKVDDKVPAQEALIGFQNQYALKLRNPESGFGLTGNTSDRDVKFLKDAVAGLDKTPYANKAILTTLLAKQRRERDLKSLYAQHLSSGEPIGDWVKKRRTFIESNPFFTPEEDAFFKNAKMMKSPSGGIKKSANDRAVADEVWGD